MMEYDDLFVIDFKVIEKNIWCVCGYYNFLFKLSSETFHIISLYRIPAGAIYTGYQDKHLVADGNNLYVFLSYENKVFRFNTLNCEYHSVADNDIKEMVDFSNCNDGLAFCTNGKSNILFEYDFRNGYKRVLNTLSTVRVIRKVQCSSEYLVFLTDNIKEIVFCGKNRLDNLLSVSLADDFHTENAKFAFSTIIPIDNSCFLVLSEHSNMSLLLNCDEGTVNKFEDNIGKYELGGYQIYTSGQKVGSKVLSFSEWKRTWMIFDCKTKETKFIYNRIQENDFEKMYSGEFLTTPEGNVDILIENNGCVKLQRFIDEILKRN